MRRVIAAVALAALGGCASGLAWPPAVERLPESAAVRPAPAPVVKPVPVTLDEIVELARVGTPSGVIIQKLRDSRLSYSITSEQAASLASKGVPSEVIGFLQHGEAAIAPRRPAAPPHYAYPYADPYGYPFPYAYPYAHPAYPAYPYSGYGSGVRYPRSSLYFGFGRRW